MEFYVRLFKQATGWLGYTPREALANNVNDLILAVDGRLELLKLIFGSSQKDKPTRKPPRMTAKRFRAMAALHNAGQSGGKKRDRGTEPTR